MSEVVRRVFTEISEHHTYVMLYQLYPVHPPPHITYHILFKFPPPTVLQKYTRTSPEKNLNCSAFVSVRRGGREHARELYCHDIFSAKQQNSCHLQSPPVRSDV